MFAYRTPGVYFEWLDPRLPAIDRVRTDIAGFIGIAARGPLHQPMKVESWTQFTSTFGGHIPQGYLAYAVEGFFANGGQTCWVVRVADPERAHPARLTLRDDAGTLVLCLTASSDGVWGQALTVTVLRIGTDRFALTIRLADGGQELWRDLSLAPSDVRLVETILNNAQTGSRLVRASRPPGSGASGSLALPRAGTWRLEGGQDGLAPSLDLLDRQRHPTLRLIAAARDVDGGPIHVTVSSDGGEYFSLTLTVSENIQEHWPKLSMGRWISEEKRQPDPYYVETVLSDQLQGSQLVIARDLRSEAAFPHNTPDPAAANLTAGRGQLAGGLNLAHLSGHGAPVDKTWGLATLETVDEVSVLAIPDSMATWFKQVRRAPRMRCDVVEAEPPLATVPALILEQPPAFNEGQIRAIQAQLIGQCERLKDRMAILDIPRFNNQEMTQAAVHAWRNEFSTKYAALYYPWLMVPDPLRLDGLLRPIPPSGHVAGVYARVDQRVGVHKPPANEVLEGTRDVSTAVDDVDHGDLNEQGVNVIRSYSGRGVRVAGARTLSRDSEWRFVNVRRLLIMIEEAIDEGTQWTVFEPNNPDLWREVDRVARSFLDGLWRRRMLDGATAEEAYLVRCDETTNPADVTERGQMICLIGVQPPWPAEFVIVRIGKTENGTEILEERKG